MHALGGAWKASPSEVGPARRTADRAGYWAECSGGNGLVVVVDDEDEEEAECQKRREE